jgi:Transposase
VSVDAFHLVKLANDAVTAVRQRVSREHKARRGRKVDASWAHRRLLLRAADTRSSAALRRLADTLRRDDPTNEIGAAWAVKEQLRRLLTSGSIAEADQHRQVLNDYIRAASMAETDRLAATVAAWCPRSNSWSSPASPTHGPRPRTRPSSRSSAPGEASATQRTTELESCSPVPPDARQEHPPQRPRSR